MAFAMAAVLSHAAVCACLRVRPKKMVVNPCLHLVILAHQGNARLATRQQHGEQRAQRLQRERPEQRAAESPAARAVYTGLRSVFVCYIY
jgi:hypothetical protein